MVHVVEYSCEKCGAVQTVICCRDLCFSCGSELSSHVDIGDLHVGLPIAPLTSSQVAESLSKGSQLWAELHSYRWTKFTDFREWFDAWLAKVDRLPYCSCGAKFRSKILPQFADGFCSIRDDDEWLAVSVAMHNAVNASLEKKPFSMDEAIKLWRANA